MDDDVDAYLKRAASLQHSHFGKRGFVVATPTAEVAGQSRGAPVMINTSSSTRVPTLPMKRKRSRQDDAAPSPPQQQQQQQPNKEPAATVSDAPRATVSLLDKWFPGITLKEATLAPSQAPSAAYVNAIVSAMTVLRERMIALRSDVEDVDGILRASASEDDHDDAASLVTSANWEGVRDVLVPLPRAGPLRTLAATRRAAAGFMTMKRDVLVKMDRPWTVNAHAWHVFLDANGPETDKAPTLSVFAWMSSASTVTLFTVLVQRLLRRWKIAASGADGGDGQTKGQHDLLCFLRLLMPCQASSSASASSSCGYGVWLFHCLAMLDIPLDADTDRLVHELFRTLCDQVRVMGEWRASVGDERGALTNSFTLMALNATSRKSYDDMAQIDRVDVCALHSLVVVLAKFFRQNQNRLIPL